jgi:hypothetical protein
MVGDLQTFDFEASDKFTVFDIEAKAGSPALHCLKQEKAI